MHGDFGLLINLSVSLVLALVLGLIAQRIHLSPIIRPLPPWYGEPCPLAIRG